MQFRLTWSNSANCSGQRSSFTSKRDWVWTDNCSRIWLAQGALPHCFLRICSRRGALRGANRRYTAARRSGATKAKFEPVNALRKRREPETRKANCRNPISTTKFKISTLRLCHLLVHCHQTYYNKAFRNWSFTELFTSLVYDILKA